MNRTHVRIALALAIILSLTAFAQTTRAASSPTTPASAPAGPAPTKVGIINMQMAILASNEGQRDFAALQKRFDPKSVEIKTKQDEIKALQTQAQAQGDKMNEEARQNLARQIDQKQTALKRLAEDAQKEFQTQSNDLGNSIGSKMFKTLDKWATANGFAVVIDVGGAEQNTNVLWAAQGVNITQAVVEAYNAESGVPAPPKAAGAPTAPSATRPQPTPTKPR